MGILITLSIALAATQLLDWHSTRTIINHGGYEQNKIMAALFDEFGMDAVLAIKAALVSVVGWWVGLQSIPMLFAIVAVYAAVIIHNWKSMPKG